MATSVITVTHNSGDVVAGMLQSLPLDVEAIVVDNASADGSAAIARAARPGAVVVELPNNNGFGHGCNVGAGVAAGDVLVFLNPDGRVVDDALGSLAALASADRRSMFGPAFLHEDGSPRHDVRRRSQPYHEALELLPSARRWTPRRLRRDLPESDSRYTSGGRWTTYRAPVSRSTIELFHRLGGFDEDFFLYSEEETLCDAVRAAGGTSIYVPAAVIEHVGGTSTSQVSAFAVYHFYRSRIIFYRKRWGWMSGLLASGLIGACLFLNWALSPVVGRYGDGGPYLHEHSAAARGLLRGCVAQLRR